MAIMNSTLTLHLPNLKKEKKEDESHNTLKSTKRNTPSIHVTTGIPKRIAKPWSFFLCQNCRDTMSNTIELSPSRVQP